MPLRVLIVAPWGERLGGAEEMLLLALAHRDKQRLEPAVVFLGPGPFVTEVEELGIPTEVIPAGRLRQPLSVLNTIGKLAATLRRHQPDVLLNWSAKAHLYGSPAAFLAGRGDRVVWWQHQVAERHWMDRIATLLPARAIGCSSTASQEAQAELFPSRRSFVVSPGIGPANQADVGAEETLDLRSALGIPPERLVVGMVGRLQPSKGQDRLLAALRILHERGRDVHGLIVGGDAYGLAPKYAAGLSRIIGELGLADRVTLTGQVSDARPYFKPMDVAVNVSKAESFGIVLLEAMAAGVPIVAFGKGGPLDIVDSGETGILIESREPEQLADALDVLISDPARREEMGAAGEARCRERFSAGAMVEALTSNLVGVANG